MSECNQRWIVLRNDQILLFNASLFFEGRLPKIFNEKSARTVHLGQWETHEYFVIEMTDHISLDNAQWVNLREVCSLSYQDHFPLVAKAFSVMRWDKYHQFCGDCSKETVLTNSAFERKCNSCGMFYYPRISPSIIVLIKRGDHVLMARGPHFPVGVYGLIAGFVEPGETLEQTVHREVQEEVGIKIKNLAYFGSQPWPFPDSLMIGFTAEYDYGEIAIDENEIEDAGWYRYDTLPGVRSMSISIAMTMIRQFVKDAEKIYG